MRGKKVNIISSVLFISVLVFFMCFSIISPDRGISLSERRKLTSFPEVSLKNIKDGKFMSEFDKYAADQFPLREQFRKGKSINEFYVYGKKDNNGIYFSDGYAAKLEYPFNEESIDYACRRFSYIYDKFISDKNANIYFSIVPDKNYFLTRKDNTPAMDYDLLLKNMSEKMPYANYIDIFPTLELSDYYKTDTHWRQEKITDTARVIAEAMNTKINSEYTEKTIDKPFYGVYCGQSALPVKPEHITILENETIDSFIVTNHETGLNSDVYDMTRLDGTDLYEIYLSGPQSFMTIENPHSENKRELVVFRDSFGSSIAPLLAQGYSRVTLIDIRYLQPDMLPRIIEFKNQDILFIYSTLVLNNSETIK